MLECGSATYSDINLIRSHWILKPHDNTFSSLKTNVRAMATQMQPYDITKDLEEFVLNDVRRTGTTLGRGAFGIVEELKIGGTLCAGKRLHPELYHQDQGLQRTIKRFTEECRLMSKMHHPRIVQFMHGALLS